MSLKILDKTWLLAVALVAVGLLTSLLAPTASAAQPSERKLIWGPTDAKAFKTYADLGAGLFEFTINWSRIAPSEPKDPTDPRDPAYQWTPAVDEAIANASEHGIEVVLLVAGAPGWANGGKSWRWAPHDPQDFADFLTAASRRWPQVRHWQIWGEPTRRENFMPLAKNVAGIELTPAQRRGPQIYAELLDSAFVALKRVSPANLVIGGSTYSGGDIRPLAFVKALRLPNGKPPRMDLYGHNPFGYRRPNLDLGPLREGSGIVDFCDLDLLAEYLDLYLARAGRNREGIPLFLSEYFLPTDHANDEFNYWVSRRTAAAWLRSAFAITRQWRRIYTLGWFQLHDEAPNGSGTEVNRGLLTHSGEKKPAYFAFREG
jgi:hypothetical protein